MVLSAVQHYHHYYPVFPLLSWYYPGPACAVQHYYPIINIIIRVPSAALSITSIIIAVQLHYQPRLLSLQFSGFPAVAYSQCQSCPSPIGLIEASTIKTNWICCFLSFHFCSASLLLPLSCLAVQLHYQSPLLS